MRTPGFRDRSDAGHALAKRLAPFKDCSPLVVGLTRGGVPVASVVAHDLGADFDICVVRKITSPTQPEFALGAVAEGNVVVIDDENTDAVGASFDDVADLARAKFEEVAARVRLYRGSAGPADVRGRTVIVVDDGLATGATARAALRSLRKRGASHLILAVPVAAAESMAALRGEADRVVTVHSLRDVGAVGVWYGDFRQIDDAEMTALVGHGRGREKTLRA